MTHDSNQLMNDVMLMISSGTSTRLVIRHLVGAPVDCFVLFMLMLWKVSFVVGVENKLLRLFYTFDCKQVVSNMLTTSTAFATHGNTQGAHPVMVTIDG